MSTPTLTRQSVTKIAQTPTKEPLQRPAKSLHPIGVVRDKVVISRNPFHTFNQKGKRIENGKHLKANKKKYDIIGNDFLSFLEGREKPFRFAYRRKSVPPKTTQNKREISPPIISEEAGKVAENCRFIDLSLGVFFRSFHLPLSYFTAWENSTSYRMLTPRENRKSIKNSKPSSGRKMRVPPCDLYPPDLGRSEEIDSLINHSLCCHKKEGKLTHCLVILWLRVLWDNVAGESR